MFRVSTARGGLFQQPARSLLQAPFALAANADLGIWNRGEKFRGETAT
jgi:hypothetical protein